jgi:2-keto-3-deoxy-L-rhamnonate aldolase RhmA
MRKNTVKQKLLENKPVFGAEAGFGSPLIAEVLAIAGFDFIQVDGQHGQWSPDRMVCAFRSICLGGALPIARVQQNDFGAIGAVMDLGALGIVIPMVNTADEAVRAVRSVLYYPAGDRSSGAIGVGIHGTLPDYVDRIKEEVLIIVQIETGEAVDRAEEILSVDGVDGCMIGPSDLSLSLGVPAWSVKHEAAIEKVLKVCMSVGKFPGIAAWGKENNSPSRRAEQGFLFIQATSDREILPNGADDILAGISTYRT